MKTISVLSALPEMVRWTVGKKEKREGQGKGDTGRWKRCVRMYGKDHKLFLGGFIDQ